MNILRLSNETRIGAVRFKQGGKKNDISKSSIDEI